MLVHIVHAPRVQSRVFTPRPQMPRRSGQTKAKHTQSTLGSPGPVWQCRESLNHDDDTGGIARGQRWSALCTYRVCKAEFSLLGPKCLVGAG